MKLTVGHAYRPYLEGGDPGIQEQTLDMLRVLLDSEACRETPPENDKFLDVFYTENMNKLVAVVNGCTERCGPCCPVIWCGASKKRLLSRQTSQDAMRELAELEWQVPGAPPRGVGGSSMCGDSSIARWCKTGIERRYTMLSRAQGWSGNSAVCASELSSHLEHSAGQGPHLTAAVVAAPPDTLGFGVRSC
jgi:hypothetical protein